MAQSITITPFSIILVATFMAFSSSSALEESLPASTISAAPAALPDSAAPSPALSPDIAPLFPSPGGSELSPTESSVPLIPSSPSPPNPDAVAAFGPGMAFSPEGMLPESSAGGPNVAVFLSSAAVVFAGVWVNRQDFVCAW